MFGEEAGKVGRVDDKLDVAPRRFEFGEAADCPRWSRSRSAR
jgi:hypothetical protein